MPSQHAPERSQIQTLRAKIDTGRMTASGGRVGRELTEEELEACRQKLVDLEEKREQGIRDRKVAKETLDNTEQLKEGQAEILKVMKAGFEGLNQRMDLVIAPPDSSANLRLQAREAAKREREEEKLRQQLQLGIPLGQGDVYQGTVLFKADALDRLEEFRERDLEAYVVVLGFKARLVMVTRQHAVVQLMPPLDLSNLKAHSNAIASNGVRLQGFHGGVVHDRLVWKAAALLGEDGKRLPKQAILRFLIPNPTRLVEKLPVAEIRPAKRRAVALETMEAHWETEKERVEPTEPEPIKESEPTEEPTKAPEPIDPEPTEEPTKATKAPEPIEEQPTKEPTKAPEPGSTKEPEPSEPKELWEMTVHGRVVRFSIEQNVGYSPLGPVREVKMEPGDADFLAPIHYHPKGIVFYKEGLYHIDPDFWSKNVTQVAKEIEPTSPQPTPTEELTAEVPEAQPVIEEKVGSEVASTAAPETEASEAPEAGELQVRCGLSGFELEDNWFQLNANSLETFREAEPIVKALFENKTLTACRLMWSEEGGKQRWTRQTKPFVITRNSTVSCGGKAADPEVGIVEVHFL